jgi:ring-1,2-phenylacetyl-CoA epoxidase subunit PaaD
MTQMIPQMTQMLQALEDVVDPEIPVVSVLDMGMIGDITIDDDGHVGVEILPTFSGCPALEIIAADVRARLARETGVRAVSVRFSYDPPWTSDRITDAGRAKLTAFGIAPAPHSDDEPTTQGRPTTPASGSPAYPEVPGQTGGQAHIQCRADPRGYPGRRPEKPLPVIAQAGIPCPHCGSTHTVQDNLFGPTPCRALYRCLACRNPFEAFKPI